MKKQTQTLPIIAVATALAFAPACGSKKKSPPKTCRKETLERVKKWMAALCTAKEATLPAGWSPGADLKLVTADRPPARQLGQEALARMEPGRLWVNGTSVKGWNLKFAQPPENKKPAVGMLGVLARAKGLFPGLGKLRAAKLMSSDVLNLAVAPGVPARQVSMLLGSAYEAGFRKVVFLFRPKNPVRPPDPPSTAGYVRLGPTAGPEKVIVAAMKIVELSRKSWTGCNAVKEAFDVLGPATPEERCRLLERGFLVAIKACNCRGNIDPLLTASHMLLQPYDPLAAFSLKLDSKAKPMWIKDGKRPWKEVAEAILKVPPNARFWLSTPDGRLPDPGVPTAPRIGQGRPRVSRPMYFTGRRRSSSRITLGKGRVQGGLERTVVRRVLRRRMQEILYCFESRVLVHNHSAKGHLDLKFKVDLKGRVVWVAVKKSTLKSGSMESCVKGSARRWRFPVPRNEPVTAVYRYSFKPRQY